MVKEKCRLAMPTLPSPSLDPTGCEALVGYPVHTRCWGLLSYHSVLGSISKSALENILHVLRRKYQEWGYGTDKSEVDAILMSQGDSGDDKRIQSLINKARRMTRKRFKNSCLNRRCRLYHLPAEVLCFVLNNLPSPDVASVEKAMGSYFGDAYWCSRIPTDLFHEVRVIMEETLDWEFLCLKIDELTNSLLPQPVVKRTKKRTKKRRVPKTVFMRQEIPEGLEGLACRQYILRRLNEVQEIVTMG